MHKLLGDWLVKLKISPENMTAEEKQTFDSWRAILDDEVITIEKIAEFCERQVSAIELKWVDKYRDRTNDPFLADIHSVYKNIAKMIKADKSERMALEKHLTDMLDKVSE